MKVSASKRATSPSAKTLATNLTLIENRMDTPNLYTLQLKLKRYKLSFYNLDDDTIQIGGVSGLKSLKLYLMYMPLIIGLVIVGFGFMIDFILLEVSGAVFLLYATYGATIVKKKVTQNKDIKILKSGELIIKQNSGSKIFTDSNTVDYVIKVEQITKETFEGWLAIIGDDKEEVLVLGLYGPDKKMLVEDLDYIKEYIRLKLNTANLL